MANPKVQGGGSTIAGTFGYMPPEQLMGSPVPATDIYSLSACAVHMLSGISPANMPVKDFRLIFEPDVQHLPPEVVNTLRKMLDPKVSDRLVDYDVIKSQFQEFVNHNFKNLSNKTSLLSKKQFFKKLMDVPSIGESGNIELWQNLDDNTPQEIPKGYDAIECNQALHYADYPFSSRLITWILNQNMTMWKYASPVARMFFYTCKGCR